MGIERIGLRHGSLFSGIGGFELAMKMNGIENVFACEIDEFCHKVLKKNYPGIKIYSDIHEFEGSKYAGKIDILSGGFPCQPYSVAGKRKGNEDDRALWKEMYRVIKEVRPPWVIGENVAGITSMVEYECGAEVDTETEFDSEEEARAACDKIHGEGRGYREGTGILETILGDLERAGYDVQPFVIPAIAVNAPHKRDRVWIIAHSENNGRRRRNGYRGKAKGKTESGFTDKLKRSDSSYRINGDIKNAVSVRCEGSESEEKSEVRGQREFGSGDDAEFPNTNLADTNSAERQFLCGQKPGQAQQGDSNYITRKRSIGAEDITDTTGEGFKESGFKGEREFSEEEREGIYDRFEQRGGEYSASTLQSDSYNAQGSLDKQHCERQSGLSNRENREWDKHWYEVAAELCRMDDGVSEELYKLETSDRVARLKSLGNAIVPQVADMIVKGILRAEGINAD